MKPLITIIDIKITNLYIEHVYLIYSSFFLENTTTKLTELARISTKSEKRRKIRITYYS